MALNAVSPLIDSVVALKNVFGEFSKSNSAAVQENTPVVAASAPAQVLGARLSNSPIAAADCSRGGV
jgi:hypothetical protein